ncbi:MAG: HD domain-containing phosphohydrolase [Planctomycetota bacterium]
MSNTKKRILLLEGQEGTRAQVQEAIGSRCDLFAVSNAEDAIEACRSSGPFAVAMAEHGNRGVSAFDLLRRVNESWPETVGLLIAPGGDAGTVSRAAKEPHVFRCLSAPFAPGALLSAVDAALSRHDENEKLETFSEEILFGMDSMESFRELLEDRVEHQTSALRRMHRFTIELVNARSTREIAQMTATAASEALGGRGVQVQLWQASIRGNDVRVGAGAEMSSCLHRTPILSPNGEIGEICADVIGPGREKLTPLDTMLLASLGASTSLAVHQEMTRRDLDQAQHATILALARLAERRDMETGRHLERVAGYCRLIAESLRALGCHAGTITDAFIEDLASSSPLHDIGKVGIPDSILLKPGSLTPEEWTIMKTHAEIGGSTLDGVIAGLQAPGFLTMGRDIAWCHHEKWDGSGYPRGLVGTEIPLCARIVALADVYDALTTVRPYKQAWPHADAIDWILSRAGTHFDPDVVAAFAARLDDADRIRSSLADPTEEQPSNAVEIAQQL